MRSQGRVPSLAKPFCLCVLLLMQLPALADSEKRQTRIICREELSLVRREELAGKLRAITGWTNLEFDSGGSLQLGINAPIGGSASARALLTAAAYGKDVLILEDASNRLDIVFCQVIPGHWKSGDSQRAPAYVVLIDFTDFDHLMGDRPALAAFNAGWGLLHEIDHVIKDSSDPGEIGRAGDCEDHINQMRRELDLPQRSDYFFTFFPQAEFSDFSTRFVRLAFDRKDAPPNKHHRYWLMWDATLVGGLGGSKQIAQLR